MLSSYHFKVAAFIQVVNINVLLLIKLRYLLIISNFIMVFLDIYFLELGPKK